MAQINAESIAHSLDKPRPNGKGFMACCPAHDDKNPSLSISETENGKILVKCFAGCSQEAVISELKSRALWPASNFTPQQKQQYHRVKTRSQLIKSLQYELFVLTQAIRSRVCDETLSRDKKFKDARPEFKQLPAEFWDREILAAKRIKKIVGDLYGC